MAIHHQNKLTGLVQGVLILLTAVIILTPPSSTVNDVTL